MPTSIEDLAGEAESRTRPTLDALVALSRQASSFSTAITGAFRAAVVGGRRFETVLNALSLKLAGIALDQALQPISNVIGNAIGSAFTGIGGGPLKPFARGGIVGGPTVFPIRGGLGVAGEAGAEAVLPLARGSDGRLGVAGGGGQPMIVNFHVTSPDASSFTRSEAQVTAMLARAVGRGRRGL